MRKISGNPRWSDFQIADDTTTPLRSTRCCAFRLGVAYRMGFKDTNSHRLHAYSTRFFFSLFRRVHLTLFKLIALRPKEITEKKLPMQVVYRAKGSGYEMMHHSVVTDKVFNEEYDRGFDK